MAGALDRRLLRLHLIAKTDQQSGKLMKTDTAGELESGNWSVTPVVAEAAVGAELHLHEKQDARSWKAGSITGWRPSESRPGCVVFRFRVEPRLSVKQVDGWGNEQARVWREI